MGNSTSHQPSSLPPPQHGGTGVPPNRCWPALTLEVKGRRLIAGVQAGLLGRKVSAVEQERIALHQLGINRPRPSMTLAGVRAATTEVR